MLLLGSQNGPLRYLRGGRLRYHKEEVATRQYFRQCPDRSQIDIIIIITAFLGSYKAPYKTEKTHKCNENKKAYK